MKKIILGVSALALAFAFSVSFASAANYSFQSNLTMGATGSDVTALQSMLVAKGYLTMPAGVAYGYFGNLTKSAVIKLQMANAISPAVGFFGPVTRAKVNTWSADGGATGGSTAGLPAGCTSTMGWSPINGVKCDTTTGSGSNTGSGSSLKGGEASLEDFNLKSEDDINEDDSKASVATAEFRVRDADAKIDRVDFELQSDSTSNSENKPWKVFDKAYLLMDGKTIASMTVDSKDDWSEVGSTNPKTYRLRFSNVDEVIKEDDKASLTLAFDVATNVDGADTSAAGWNVEVANDGIRAIDGEGIDQYTGDTTDTVNFEINVAGENEDLTFRETSDNPSADTLMVNDDTTSDWYTVLAFETEADKSNDVTIHSLPITLTFSGTSTYAKVIDDAQLVIDGEVFDDFTVGSTTGATTSLSFDLDNGSNDVVVSAGDSLPIEVKLKFKKQSGNYAQGVTVSSDVTSSNVDAVDAEGADDLTASQLKGSVEGDDFSLRTQGVNVTLVDENAVNENNTDATTTDDEGVYTLKFEVTAFEQEVYIPLTAASSTSATCTSGACFLVEDSTNVQAGTGSVTSALSRVSGGTQTGNYIHITSGSKATFELQVNYNPATTGFYRAQLYSVNYADSATTPDTHQILSPEEDYDTAAINVKN